MMEVDRRGKKYKEGLGGPRWGVAWSRQTDIFNWHLHHNSEIYIKLHLFHKTSWLLLHNFLFANLARMDQRSQL